MAFIKFTEYGRSHSAKASISKTGMLSFSDGARRRFGLEDFGYCVLYYDPDTRRVGIELITDKEAEGARRIRFRATGADIAARSFVERFDLAVRQTIVYPIERDDETGYLIIDLEKGRVRSERKTQGTIDRLDELE